MTEHNMEPATVTNHPVLVQELPGFGQLPTEPVSPRYRKLNLAVTLVFSALIDVVLLAILLQPWFEVSEAASVGLTTGLICISTIGGLLFSYHFYADKLIFYTLREQDIVLYKGLIFKKVVCQPMLRIQHIDIQRGPLERLAGLATVKVYSAGGSDHSLAIPGLPNDTAQKLRQFVLDHSDLTRD